jgi:hypothetical protein
MLEFIAEPEISYVHRLARCLLVSLIISAASLMVIAGGTVLICAAILLWKFLPVESLYMLGAFASFVALLFAAATIISKRKKKHA